MHRQGFKGFLLPAFLCTVLAVAGIATAGTVVDPKSALVPSATVTIRNDGTGAEKKLVTDNSGFFRASNLQPGSYTVTVSASGFSDFTTHGVSVTVGSVTEIRPILTLGGTAETVTVNTSSTLVNFESAAITSTVDQTEINNLPINGRRWSNFALLTPGANPDGGFGLIAFRGISGLLNNNTIDGGDDNQAFFSEARGRTRAAYSFTQAAVQEFQVNTSNYSAQYGRSAGAVVNTISKSGTNQFHGSGFYYWRDNGFGATNPFALQTILNSGVTTTIHIKPKDKRHQWGGSLGGPLLKDRLFFFDAYDEQTHNFPGVATFSNPAYLNTVAPGTAGATTLAARGVTAAQIQSAQQFLIGLTGVVPRTGTQVVNFPKLDWKINDRNTATVQYNRLRWDSPAGIQTSPVVSRGIASFGDDFVKVDSIIGRLTTTFTPTLTNESRYQNGRDFEFENPQTPAPGEARTSLNGFSPSVSLGGGGLTFGSPNFLNRRAYPDERRNQVVDTITQVHGNHTFTYGVDYNHVQDRTSNRFSEYGAYSYSNLANFITDFAFQGQPRCDAGRTNAAGTLPCYTNYQQGFGRPGFTIATNEIAGYFQDDWKLRRNLTVNLGLRYEYQKLADPQIPNPAASPTASAASDKTDIGPRAGFAWDPYGLGKTVVRGGYGIYYGRTENSTNYNAIINTGASDGQFQGFFVPSTGPTYPNTLPSTTNVVSTPNIVFFDKDFKNPAVQQADLAVQQDLGWGTIFSVNYLLSLGRHLPTFVDTNIAPATKTITYTVAPGGVLAAGGSFTVPFYTARINPAFGQETAIRSAINSSYNALVAELQHRFAHGIQFDANYTWSKAIDDGQTSTTFTTSNAPTDPYNLQFDRGLSNFDNRHRFVLAAVAQPHVSVANRYLSLLANDWELAPIFIATTGAPYSAA